MENPATGETIASVPKGSAEDADRAVQAAWTAQPAWEALPPQSRGLLLRALARLDPREPRAAGGAGDRRAGQAHRTRRAARSRARRCYLVYAAEEARRITGDIIPSDNPDEQIWIQKVAHGVVVALTAWNYPAALMTRKIGPALIAGNTVVVKSHEGTPTVALEIAQLSVQAGFPPGVINVVSGTGEGDGPGARHATR